MLGIRWTIGDVNPRGFAALRLSVWGAWRLFGAAARYRIHVNTIDVETARARTGELPTSVEWECVHPVIPRCLAAHLDPSMAEGVAWKLLPLRAFPDDHELALDNDVVLWDMPIAVNNWLSGQAEFLLAEDVRAAFGRFSDLCGEHPINTGMRGLPPGFELDEALAGVLAQRPGVMTSELDEQGLQVAALIASGMTAIVTLDDVTICSPFPPHVPHLGRAGAHFVGLNTRRLGFEWNGRAAEEVRAEHWDAHAREVARRVGV
ncbi:MAG: hypothetical protein ACTHU0_37735 [Kofleriaceae bacterium]